MASTKSLLSMAASVATSVIVARTIMNDLLPYQFHSFAFSLVASFCQRFSTGFTIVIDEYESFAANDMFRAVEAYLGRARVPSSVRRMKVIKQEGTEAIGVAMERGEQVTDVFQGAKFTWKLVCHERQQTVYHNQPAGMGGFMNASVEQEVKSYELSFHRKEKDKAVSLYLPYILEKSKRMKEEEKTIKIHKLRAEYMHGFREGGPDVWLPVNLNHPSTFDTLAMDVELKMEVVEDLERFIAGKEYYRSVGRAWKRGYLLYGPPGTGKSSLIAAMANYLKYDVYDLELSAVQSNSLLQTILITTANRSILVVEDIDCTIDLQERSRAAAEAHGGFRSRGSDQVTLSGLLNFVDGLWSSCGDERIIVFTTNHKDKLDPALLRPGRMDMHIHMSYCGSHGFRCLASTYHTAGGSNHPLFEEVEELLKVARVTPAEVAGELMKSGDLEVALRGLVKFIGRKRSEEEVATTEESGAGEGRGIESGSAVIVKHDEQQEEIQH